MEQLNQIAEVFISERLSKLPAVTQLEGGSPGCIKSRHSGSGG